MKSEAGGKVGSMVSWEKVMMHLMEGVTTKLSAHQGHSKARLTGQEEVRKDSLIMKILIYCFCYLTTSILIILSDALSSPLQCLLL